MADCLQQSVCHLPEPCPFNRLPADIVSDCPWVARQRKQAMEMLLRRTQAQEAADSAVLAEASIIEGARKAEAAARRAAGR